MAPTVSETPWHYDEMFAPTTAGACRDTY